MIVAIIADWPYKGKAIFRDIQIVIESEIFDD
jgi:hypothetical protein